MSIQNTVNEASQTPGLGKGARTNTGSLQTKIMLFIVAVVTIILVALGAYDYQDNREVLTNDLLAKQTTINERLAANLVSSIWDFDQDSAAVTMKSEMGEHAIYGFSIFEADGKTIFAGAKRNNKWEPESHAEAITGDYIVSETDIVRNGENIGKLTTYVTDKFITESLNKMLVSLAIRTVLIDVMLIVVLLFLVRRYIFKPLGKIQEFAAGVKDGNLDCKLREGRFSGELLVLKDAMEAMVCNLKDQMQEVSERQKEAEEQTAKAKEAAEQADAARREAENARREGMLQAAGTLEGIVDSIHGASERLNIQVNEVSHGAQRQAERAAETATAMEEMNATVLEVARNASETAQMAQDARDKADEGANVVQEVITSIDQVNTKADSLKDNMGELLQQAQGTGQIINVITDIADQTNLLALNAAIEAARAGDAGRGFAVVADEVRKLAEKTMDATKQVEQSILAIQNGTNLSTGTTEEAVQAVGKATDLASTSGAALDEILNLVGQTTGQIASIATAAEQQSATSEEINRSVEDINMITRETSEGMAQAEEAIHELAGLVDQLNRLISELKA